MTVEEQKRVKPLILSGGCHMLFLSEVREERFDVFVSEFSRMRSAMELHEANDPVDVSLLCPVGVVISSADTACRALGI